MYVGERDSWGLGLRRRLALGGVLKDTLGAGVMDVQVTPNQPLEHRDLAPGAETVGNLR
jgi:hypothetical protein